MLSSITKYLNAINGIAIWPTIAFVFFFLFFLLMLWWVITTPKAELEHIANVPLADNEGSTNMNDCR
jgi:cytochrome c oxidase cbb3-type subunit 4